MNELNYLKSIVDLVSNIHDSSWRLKLEFDNGSIRIKFGDGEQKYFDLEPDNDIDILYSCSQQLKEYKQRHDLYDLYEDVKLGKKQLDIVKYPKSFPANELELAFIKEAFNLLSGVMADIYYFLDTNNELAIIINVNDVFAPAADAERVEMNDLTLLKACKTRMEKLDNPEIMDYLGIYFTAKKRGEKPWRMQNWVKLTLNGSNKYEILWQLFHEF